MVGGASDSPYLQRALKLAYDTSDRPRAGYKVFVTIPDPKSSVTSPSEQERCAKPSVAHLPLPTAHCLPGLIEPSCVRENYVALIASVGIFLSRHLTGFLKG